MNSLSSFLAAYGYLAVFGGVVIQQVVALVLGEPFLVGAGALIGTRRLSLWLAARSRLRAR
jgi:membrane protein DedA with SNARE-associated domain